MFFRNVTNDYCFRVVSLVHANPTFFDRINSLRGYSKIKKAMAIALLRRLWHEAQLGKSLCIRVAVQSLRDSTCETPVNN